MLLILFMQKKAVLLLLLLSGNTLYAQNGFKHSLGVNLMTRRGFNEQITAFPFGKFVHSYSCNGINYIYHLTSHTSLKAGVSIFRFNQWEPGQGMDFPPFYSPEKHNVLKAIEMKMGLQRKTGFKKIGLLTGAEIIYQKIWQTSWNITPTAINSKNENTVDHKVVDLSVGVYIIPVKRITIQLEAAAGFDWGTRGNNIFFIPGNVLLMYNFWGDK